MELEIAKACILDASGTVTLSELHACSGLSEEDLIELVEQGTLAPDDRAASTWTFRADAIVMARTASRLRREFALEDAHSLCVVMRFSQRVEALERELATLRARRG